MTYSPRLSGFNFQVSIVPCPPAHADAWYAAIRLFWQWIEEERQHQPLSVAGNSYEYSSNKNRKVPKFTANPCLGETCEKTTGSQAEAMSHNNGLCDTNGPDQGDSGSK